MHIVKYNSNTWLVLRLLMGLIIQPGQHCCLPVRQAVVILFFPWSGIQLRKNNQLYSIRNKTCVSYIHNNNDKLLIFKQVHCLHCTVQIFGQCYV